MNEIIQWALAALCIAGFVITWRIERNTRNAHRLQQEHEKAVATFKQYATDLGHLNQRRAAINERYDDTVTKIREKFGIEDVA